MQELRLPLKPQPGEELGGFQRNAETAPAPVRRDTRQTGGMADEVELDLAWAEAGRTFGRALRLTFDAAAGGVEEPQTPAADSVVADLPLTMSVAEAPGAACA